jgi:hypothetical protein
LTILHLLRQHLHLHQQVNLLDWITCGVGLLLALRRFLSCQQHYMD